MSNMSYCRFKNTVGDLIDCYRNFGDDVNSIEEWSAREKMLKICKKIVDEYDGCEFDKPED